MPERARRNYPDDPRWGKSEPAGLLGLVINEQPNDRSVNSVQRALGFYEEKYPKFHWWRREFVDRHPVVALLLQSVNDELAFASEADLMELTSMVAQQHKFSSIGRDEKPEVYSARLANMVLQGDEFEQALARSIMTNGDRIELEWLIAGNPRVSEVRYID